MKSLTLLTAVACSLASLASANPISGRGQVIDGDTLYVGNIKIRLQGIDAPEKRKLGGSYATNVLKNVVGNGEITCNLTGEVTYDRLVGVCFNSAGQDLAAETIRTGAALDCARYSGGRYRALEPIDARSKLKQARYC